QEQFKVNQPGGFHVNNNDTTSVLSPISEQADETETSSQRANALSGDGQPKTTDSATSGSDKAAPEKKRSGRLSENKRIKIFCGSSNKPLREDICRTNNGCDALLRLCTAGSERPAACRDYIEAGCRPSDHCRCEPGTARGSACSADSGVLQHSGGSLVRQPGAGELLPGVESAE